MIPGTTFDLEGELAGFVPLLKSVGDPVPASGDRRPCSPGRRWRPRTGSGSRARRSRTGRSEFVLEAEIVDAAGTVVAATRGVYQLRKLG